MRPCLCISKDRNVFSSVVSIKLQWDSVCFSGSKQYTLKVVNIQITWECHFSLFKTLLSAAISLLVFWYCKLFLFSHRAVFQWHTWKYSKTIPKLFQGFRNTLIKVNESVYIAQSGQRHYNTLNKILLHVSSHALKDLCMLFNKSC